MHIPAHLLLPQDMVMLRDLGPEDDRFAEPKVALVHASDARHAIDVEPGRFELDGLESALPKPAEKPVADADPAPKSRKER